MLRGSKQDHPNKLFGILPIDIAFYLFAFLGPFELKLLAITDKNSRKFVEDFFNQNAEHLPLLITYWTRVFKRHFPSVKLGFFANRNNRMIDEFIRARNTNLMSADSNTEAQEPHLKKYCKDFIPCSNKINQLLYYANEGVAGKIIELLPLEDQHSFTILCTNIKGKFFKRVDWNKKEYMLRDVIVSLKSQQLLNHVFQLARNYLPKADEAYDDKKSLLAWAFYCNQDEETLNELLARFVLEQVYFKTFCIAARLGHIECAKVLLEKKKDSKIGISAQLAAQYDQADFIQFLLKNGLNINAPTFCYPMLYQAAMYGHLKTVKLLLDNHADVNVTHHDGSTSLHTAAANGHTEVVKELLNRGADIHAEDHYKTTPLDAATTNGHTDTVNVLSNWHNSLHKAFK